jgi:hypothetical protein
VSAIQPGEVERFRPLLPVGYEAGVAAYRAAAAELTARDLAQHYTSGLAFFHDQFAPNLKAVLAELSGGTWDLADYVAYAAGSDVDFITHLVEAFASVLRRRQTSRGTRPVVVSWRAFACRLSRTDI